MRTRSKELVQKVCSIDGCHRTQRARGWCNSHYAKWYRNGDPLVSGGGSTTTHLPPPDPCAFLGCGTPTRGVRGLCITHNKRAFNLESNYGIDWVDYDRMVMAQCGVCAICGDPPEAGPGNFLVVDHDHSTGAIRGLLCHPCNWALGNLRDSPRLLQAAIEYLGVHHSH